MKWRGEGGEKSYRMQKRKRKKTKTNKDLLQKPLWAKPNNTHTCEADSLNALPALTFDNGVTLQLLPWDKHSVEVLGESESTCIHIQTTCVLRGKNKQKIFMWNSQYLETDLKAQVFFIVHYPAATLVTYTPLGKHFTEWILDIFTTPHTRKVLNTFCCPVLCHGLSMQTISIWSTLNTPKNRPCFNLSLIFIFRFNVVKVQ